jgi:hypothetical protein
MANSTLRAPADIIARPGTYYRRARFLICGIVLFASAWFAYDGWINWPNERDEFYHLTESQQSLRNKPHTELDIKIQKDLAIGLLPFAPLLLGFFIYRSRGVYRLSGTTLYVPGHPPVEFSDIVGLDKSQWPRKGIAIVLYHDGKSTEPREMILDDFVYEQLPTDKIVEIVETHLLLAGTRRHAEAGENYTFLSTSMIAWVLMTIWLSSKRWKL